MVGIYYKHFFEQTLLIVKAKENKRILWPSFEHQLEDFVKRSSDQDWGCSEFEYEGRLEWRESIEEPSREVLLPF